MLDSGGRVREDASPTAQKIRCKEHTHYLSRKAGVPYEIVEHISDEGFSAKNVNRPGYKKMWNIIASKTIDFVIASELSRLSRSVHDFLELVNHCSNHDVDLIIIGLDLDTSGPFGRVIVIILVALAQFEREMTSLRVKENALTRLLNDGKINGGAPILGLDRDPKNSGHFRPNKEELKQVETLLNLFLKEPSKKTLIRRAMELNITGKSGKPLTMHSVTILLDNCKWRYRGLWPANKENKDKDQESLPENKRYQIVKLPHGPLLNKTLLDKVEEKLKETYDTKKRIGKDNYVYLLSKILEYEDGTLFHGAYGKGGLYRYYYNDANRIRIRCDILDNLLWEKIKAFFLSTKDFHKKIKKAYRYLEDIFPALQEQIAALELEIEKIHEEERSLENHLNTERLGEPSYSDFLKKKVADISKKKKTAENSLSLLMQYRANVLNKRGFNMLEDGLKKYLDDGFNSLSKTTQRAIIQKLIPKIVIRNEGKNAEANLLNPLDFVVTSNMTKHLESFDKSEISVEKVLVGKKWRERRANCNNL